MSLVLTITGVLLMLAEWPAGHPYQVESEFPQAFAGTPTRSWGISAGFRNPWPGPVVQRPRIH